MARGVEAASSLWVDTARRDAGGLSLGAVRAHRMAVAKGESRKLENQQGRMAVVST